MTNLMAVPLPADVALERIAFSVGTAAFQLYLAQARRDRGMISGDELAVVERIAGPLARKSYSLVNPFTGERRRISF